MRVKGRGSTSPPVVHRLPLTQARVNLGAVVKRARLYKEYFVLEKDGIPVAGLMDIDASRTTSNSRTPRCARSSRRAVASISPARADPPGTSSGPSRRAPEASPRDAGRRDAALRGPDRPPVRPAPSTPDRPPSRVCSHLRQGARDPGARPAQREPDSTHPEARWRRARRGRPVSPPDGTLPVPLRHRRAHGRALLLRTSAGGHLPVADPPTAARQHRGAAGRRPTPARSARSISESTDSTLSTVLPTRTETIAWPIASSGS